MEEEEETERAEAIANSSLEVGALAGLLFDTRHFSHQRLPRLGRPLHPGPVQERAASPAFYDQR